MTKQFNWGMWFTSGPNIRESNRQLPPECIADCSGQGPVDQAVEYWVNRLDFDGPSWLFREYLKAYGAWDTSELCDHWMNRMRVLWIWACNCSEEPGMYDYLYLGG